MTKLELKTISAAFAEYVHLTVMVKYKPIGSKHCSSFNQID